MKTASSIVLPDTPIFNKVPFSVFMYCNSVFKSDSKFPICENYWKILKPMWMVYSCYVTAVVMSIEKITQE